MTDQRHYDPNESVIFRKVHDPFGSFSNMAPGFPLQIGNTKVKTSEALYQALKFPNNPKAQAEILQENSPLAAKMRSRFHESTGRPDWLAIRVGVMRWCLTVKLLQHESFGKLLLDTGDKSIVEHSERDQFWGANEGDDGLFHGTNCLGRLLMQLRQRVQTEIIDSVQPLPVKNFMLLDIPIETIYRTP